MLSLVNRDSDIISIISRWVKLEVDGDNFIGTCPACEVEMLIVSPERQMYYCFECHRGGNAADFIACFSRPWIVQEQLNILAAIKRRSFKLVK